MNDFKLVLERLISIKSLSGSEYNMRDFLLNFLKEKGVDAIISEGNIFVHINNGSKKCLIFNAHLDTVDVGNISLWNSDPFQLLEKDNRYFGLGVSDEKISVALLVDLILELKNSSLNTDVFFVFVVNEELDGSGSASFVDYFIKHHSYETIACILCEPTNASFIELGNKGNIFLEVITRGKSSHSSRPFEAVNAVDIMFEAIKKSREIIKSIGLRSEQLGETTITAPTKISAGDSVNKIPDLCTAVFDIRTIPETHDLIMGLLNAGVSSNDVLLRFYVPPCRPSLTSESENIVKLFEQSEIKEKSYNSGSNDACFFTNIGIPCVVFGAGNKNAVHQPNEYVDIVNIAKTKKIYLEIINNF